MADADQQSLDMENRDPNSVNPHLKTAFDDVFAEPDDTHSIDCAWKTSFKCFRYSKIFCYQALSVICGIPIAFMVGISFAALLFQHIWCVMPAIRQFQMQCVPVRMAMRAVLESCVAPCCRSFGLCLSRIKILKSVGSEIETEIV